MRLALVADAYPPARTSAAVQLRDLAAALRDLGHDVTVVVPRDAVAGPAAAGPDGISVVRFRSPRIKDTSRVRRFVAECAMPWCGIRAVRGLADRFDGVVWYSPSIFHGPLVRWIKQRDGCRSYLILRDIFPQWAIDTGVLRRGVVSWLLQRIERRQYGLADTIGVQAESARRYLAGVARPLLDRCELLENWLAASVPDPAPGGGESDPFFATRKVFVYAGNMGVAQSAGVLLDLAAELLERTDIGFSFVGRGSEYASLRDSARRRGLSNVRFGEEIPPEQVPGMLSRCRVGLVALDPRHTTDNVPGKFLAYMRAGLPVLACLNENNELGRTIVREDVGAVWHPGASRSLAETALGLEARLAADGGFADRCRALAEARYSPVRAARQIVAALRA